MQRIIMMVGISGSGKTTLAQHISRSSDGKVINLNRDELRTELFPDLHNEESVDDFYKHPQRKDMEDQVTTLQRIRLYTELGRKKDVIISDTNISPKAWNYYASVSEELSIPLDVYLLDVDMNIAIERDNLRKCPVGRDVIERQYRSLIMNRLERKYPVEVANIYDLYQEDIDSILDNQITTLGEHYGKI